MSQEAQSRQNQGSGGQKQQMRTEKKKSAEKREKEQEFHLKTVDRVLKWPVVDVAWNEGNHVYGKLKGLNIVFSFPIKLAEMSYHTMAKLTKPLFMTLELPIIFVDDVLDKGLEKFEEKAPFVKNPPMAIYNNTKEFVMVVIQPPLDCATTVLQFTKSQTNNILHTKYGNWAVTKIDNLSAGAEKLIDRFCKLTGEGEDLASSVKTPAKEDPLVHVVETIGSLLGIVSRRVLVKFTS